MLSVVPVPTATPLKVTVIAELAANPVPIMVTELPAELLTGFSETWHGW